MSRVVRLRRPKAICFDILGTASKSGFVERILFPYLKLNMDAYLTKHWEEAEFKRLFKRIQDYSVELNKSEPSTPIVLAHNTSQAKSSLINFLNFCNDNGVQSPPVTQLRFKIWFEGYSGSQILTPIYRDVPSGLRRWFAEGIKFYVFSNTWVEAQKALLRNTNHGDLTNLIAGHFDNDFGLLNEPDSWRRFCAQVRQRPEDTLFLTKSVQEGKAALDAGLQVVLVLTHRHNVKAVGPEDRQRFPYVRTLDDLQWLEGSMMPGDQPVSGAGASATGANAARASATGISGTGASRPSTASSPVSAQTTATQMGAAAPSSATNTNAASAPSGMVSSHATGASNVASSRAASSHAAGASAVSSRSSSRKPS